MFDIHQTLTDIGDGAWDNELVDDYCDGLIHQFAASPEGIAIAERYHNIGWVRPFLDFGFDYIASAPPDMTRGEVREILFDLFPRKVSTEAENAVEIIAELRAFFEFLHRQYGLSNAQEILLDLGDDAVQDLEDALSDNGNFGMAKSLFMMGADAGFDMTTQEGMDKFLLAYNSAVLDRQPIDSGRDAVELPHRTLSSSPRKPQMVRLSAEERKSREKLRRKKLGKSKRRR